MEALTAYRTFHATHAPHGPLVFGADEPAATGYRVWAACPRGAAWEWWVSVAEVVGTSMGRNRGLGVPLWRC
jgi:hypothetical protein